MGSWVSQAMKTILHLVHNIPCYWLGQCETPQNMNIRRLCSWIWIILILKPKEFNTRVTQKYLKFPSSKNILTRHNLHKKQLHDCMAWHVLCFYPNFRMQYSRNCSDAWYNVSVGQCVGILFQKPAEPISLNIKISTDYDCVQHC